MPTNALRKTLSRLWQVLTVNDLTDGELLKRFLTDRDEKAFAILVRRHGSLVMGVARRALGNVHDAEDVFQATFLFLAQKARSVVKRQALPGWLYTVAYRTALAARERIGRRRQKEQQVEHMPHPEVRQPEANDWQGLLDEEVQRLPEKYRLPVILCDLQDRPHREVCRQLRLAESTLSSRLSTARKKLAARLTRRGITLSAGALATTLSETAASAVPPALITATAKTAVLVAAGRLTAISSSVLILMKIGAQAMFLAKLKAALVTVAVLGFVGVGIVYSGGGGSPQPKNELESLRRENELLKVNLRVTLEKIEALEKQVAGLKGDTTKQRHAARELDAYRLYAEQMGAARLEQAAKQQALAEAERARTDDLALRLTRKQAIAVADAERARADAIAARADADLALRLTHKKLQEMDAIMILVSKLRASQENKEGRQQALDALDGLLKKLRDGEQKGKAAEPAKKNPGSQ